MCARIAASRRSEAHTLIAEQLTRPPNPSHEIEDAITKAYNEVSTLKRSGTLNSLQAAFERTGQPADNESAGADELAAPGRAIAIKNRCNSGVPWHLA